MKIFSAILALAVAAVSADNIVSVTSPLTGTVYTAGKSAIISWVNPTVDQISQIVFSQGLSTALQPVSVIATNVDASSGTYTWEIPADTPAGTDYAFVFGTSPNQSYTGQFTVKSAAESSVAASAAAPAAESSSAAHGGHGAASSAAPSAAVSSSGSGYHGHGDASSSAAAAESSTSSDHHGGGGYSSAASNNVAAVGVVTLIGAAVAALI
ncbi:hypothetical protein J3Q64DRAFT_1740093 [Phycomyces blakesleeanus]|uniref:Yeast cell wall synthesis Kre9/Knh1-like N-terminal domain-containing protein n=2 Tax=Phycomyces blakesleeanus TaxID=4837 RepID=A0A162PY64_PHYB8|nr:hypothetical protein PHYBLDRAFT_143571 [Phycomyces blakesleeanus NRRL 1555(-)]OAD75316.1 hypothetical protein PHYBLDRAFT_143571 [Phycomyces blakesleeanus NRRL 1555(-)]|eukprot:XP_018293356.1 hypothetical protein PHYBLDRAFT_143571 [Phycomyces blakesleeanus NRRL 1555(-)]